MEVETPAVGKPSSSLQVTALHSSAVSASQKSRSNSTTRETETVALGFVEAEWVSECDCMDSLIFPYGKSNLVLKISKGVQVLPCKQ